MYCFQNETDGKGPNASDDLMYEDVEEVSIFMNLVDLHLREVDWQSIVG